MLPDHDFKHISKFNDFHADGPAIFFKRSVFELVHSHLDRFWGITSSDSVEKLSSRVFGIVVLRHILTGKLFQVGVVHLKSKHEMRETREKEIMEFLYFYEKVSEEFKTDF